VFLCPCQDDTFHEDLSFLATAMRLLPMGRSIYPMVGYFEGKYPFEERVQKGRIASSSVTLDLITSPRPHPDLLHPYEDSGKGDHLGTTAS